MTYIISIILIILCFMKKKSKMLFMMVLLWMWILMAFNYTRADYGMYIQLYQKYSTSSILYDAEILFQLLCRFGGILKFDYKTFYALYSILPILISGLAIKKTTKNVSIVAACFLIFPFAIDAAQMRHFLAVSLVTYGATFILVSDKKIDMIKFIICNLIAIGFHYSSAFFLLLIFAKKLNETTIKRLLKVLLVVEVLMISSNKVIPLLGDLIPIRKLNAYFVSSRWRIELVDVFVVSFFQIMIFPIIYFAKHIYNVNCKETSDPNYENNIRILNTVIKFDYIMLFLLPAYFYNMELMRIFRGTLLLNYIGISIAFYHKNIKNNVLVFGDIVGCSLIYCYFLIIHTGTIGTTILDLLKRNTLIG